MGKLLGQRIVEKTTVLNDATEALKASIALCFPLGKAKTLADQIGGLTESEAYKAMVALLKSDEIDQIDADEFTELLKMECGSHDTGRERKRQKKPVGHDEVSLSIRISIKMQWTTIIRQSTP